MKRKDVEDEKVKGELEFSGFLLSSPAKKMRRLDAELPAIMEEEEPEASVAFKQQLLEEQMNGGREQVAAAMTASLLNEERTLVLYELGSTSLLPSTSSSNISFKVNPDVIAFLKTQAFWPRNPNSTTATNNFLAVVPWVPSQDPLTTHGMQETKSRRRSFDELMEVEEADVASMEVEEEVQAVDSRMGHEGFQQWQQHCMTPQLPPSTSPHLMWSW